MSEEYEKFLNWCEDRWEHDYKMQKLLSKLSNGDKDFLKEQYEARLKTDMVAILEELREQLREMHDDFFETEHFDKAYGVSNSMYIIQQKIDKLRGDENEQ